MTTAELVNLIIKKFGGNRVTFNRIDDNAVVVFKLGGREYIALYMPIDESITVKNCEHRSSLFTSVDNYSRWVEGVLNGMVRDEEGNLVKA